MGGFVHFCHKGKGFCPRGVLSVYHSKQPILELMQVYFRVVEYTTAYINQSINQLFYLQTQLYIYKVANPYGLSVRITEFDLFHSLTAIGPKSYGYKIILLV